MLTISAQPKIKKSSVLDQFHTLFLYPQQDYLAVAERCMGNLEGSSKEEFSTFLEFIRDKDLDELQSFYTEIFELNFHIAPYVGYHLFGESYLRSIFLVELIKRYREFNFEPIGELPDHLGVILKFIADNPESELARELIDDAVIPCLRRIVWTKVRPEDRPLSVGAGLAYYSLISSLLNFLTGEEKISNDVLVLPVHDSPIQKENKIDQWIRKGKKKEEQ